MPEKFNVVNSSGRKVSLLSNCDDDDFPQKMADLAQKYSKDHKKHTCIYPNCTRSFSTSGHLARHYRIHTGEKNFRCLLPQCNSRFSRQDNMMQHFRTHFLAKSKPRKIIIPSDFNTLPPILNTPVSSPTYLPPINFTTSFPSHTGFDKPY